MKDFKVGMYILTNSLIIAMIFLGCVSVSFIVGGICKYTLNVTEESGFGFFWMLLFGVCLFLAFIACSLYLITHLELRKRVKDIKNLKGE